MPTSAQKESSTENVTDQVTITQMSKEVPRQKRVVNATAIFTLQKSHPQIYSLYERSALRVTCYDPMRRSRVPTHPRPSPTQTHSNGPTIRYLQRKHIRAVYGPREKFERPYAVSHMYGWVQDARKDAPEGDVSWGGNRLAYPHRTGFRPVSDQCQVSVSSPIHSPCHHVISDLDLRSHVGCTEVSRPNAQCHFTTDSHSLDIIIPESDPMLVGKRSVDVWPVRFLLR